MATTKSSRRSRSDPAPKRAARSASGARDKDDDPPPKVVEGSAPSGPLQANTIRIKAVRDGKPIVVDDLDALRREMRTDCWTWIDVVDPDAETLEKLGASLGLHPLVTANVGERSQRAKVEQIGALFHIVMFALHFEHDAETTEIDFVLSPKFLLSVHDADWDPYTAPQLREDPHEHIGKGPDFLLYALCDWIVDGYFPVLDHLEDEIDQLQDDVIQRASPATLQRLFGLKRELIGLRRATSPEREIFNQLTNREAGVIAPDHLVYFRDVYDHLIRVTDELDNYRELVSGTLDVYLSTVNNNLSLIMKRLTGVTVILAGIGAVAGIFGMSEAGAAFSRAEAPGFWLVSSITVVIAVTAAFILRRFDWI
ncbi:MAG TPA: magnesium transporter CorA family protein [Candidatus Limnocylindrales bacterium]|nr:magnesium transporter CorA family protein [Candidatus Limnocylindrales bacterium]